MFRSILSATVAAIVLTGSTAHAASTWTIDSAHTSAQFAVRHLTVSTVRGTLGKVTGTLVIDTTDVSKSSVEATIDVTGIDTREPKRDEHLRSPDFFDAAKFPTITFKSTQVQMVVNNEYQVTGNLTLHGVTKPVMLYVQGSPDGLNDPFGNVKLGGVVNAKINRKDYGLNWNKTLDSGGVVVGDEVEVTIDVELIKKAPPAGAGS